MRRKSSVTYSRPSCSTTPTPTAVYSMLMMFARIHKREMRLIRIIGAGNVLSGAGKANGRLFKPVKQNGLALKLVRHFPMVGQQPCMRPRRLGRARVPLERRLPCPDSFLIEQIEELLLCCRWGRTHGFPVSCR